MTTLERKIARDQGTSGFTAILQRLCLRAGVRMAALVDREGETVDYAGKLAADDIRLAAAECQLLLRLVQGVSAFDWSNVHQLVLRAERASYQVVSLGEGYVLALQLARHCFGASQRAIAEASRELSREARLEPRRDAPRGSRWVSVEVRTAPDDRRRPLAVRLGQSWCTLEILGRVARSELARTGPAYRARLDNGAELTLLREPFGSWYFEEHWD